MKINRKDVMKKLIRSTAAPGCACNWA